MRKIFLCLISILMITHPTLADDPMADINTQRLMIEIENLRRQIATETETLEECARRTRGFQIAGGITLGLTAVGIGVNVYQAHGRRQTRRAMAEVTEELNAARARLEILKTSQVITAFDVAQIDVNNLDEQGRAMLQRLIAYAQNGIRTIESLNNGQGCLIDAACTETLQGLRNGIAEMQRILG